MTLRSYAPSLVLVVAAALGVAAPAWQVRAAPAPSQPAPSPAAPQAAGSEPDKPQEPPPAQPPASPLAVPAEPSGVASVASPLTETAAASAPAPKPTPAPTRTALSASYLQTVRWITTQVRQKCWEPVLKERAPGARSRAVVKTTITTAASGRVQSVSTRAASPGFPGLVHCIEKEVRGWTFPASSRKIVAHVPFVLSPPPLLPPVSSAGGCIIVGLDAFESSGGERTQAP